MRREDGVEAHRMGPLTAWRLECEGAVASLRLQTERAEYMCCKPASTYKKVFVLLEDRTAVAFEVSPEVHCKALSLKP